MPILSTNKHNFSPPRECESDDTAQQWLHPIFEIIASRNRSKEDLTSILRCLMTTIIGNLRISFHSTLKTRAQPFFTVHCGQFTLKIDNILGILWIQRFKFQKNLFSRTKSGPTYRQFTLKIDNMLWILWIQSFKFQNPFFTIQSRADSLLTQKVMWRIRSVCFDFIKAALPDNETVLLKIIHDGVNDTLLIYFSRIVHTKKNEEFRVQNCSRRLWKLKNYKLHCTHFISQSQRTISK